MWALRTSRVLRYRSDMVIVIAISWKNHLKLACSFEPLIPIRCENRKQHSGSERRKRQMPYGESDYKVGPGKPPLHTRFRKG